MKKKFVRANQALFMARNVRKEMHTRYRLRNRFCNDPTKENDKLYKKRRNKYVALRRNINDNNIVTNEQICNLIRPFLVNKVSLNSCEIMIGKENKVITTPKR